MREAKHAEGAVHISEYAYGYHKHSQGAKVSAARGRCQKGHVNQASGSHTRGDMTQHPS